jgi:hypothetical protein
MNKFNELKEIIRDMSKHFKEYTFDLIKEIKQILPELETYVRNPLLVTRNRLKYTRFFLPS